jgi:ABC-type sugar transport system ATPase subunit
VEQTALLKLINISKQFPGVKALDKVCMDIRRGEVHALCGENGAGKSTLMNVLSGICRPDEGRILIDGKEIVIENQAKAQQLGISTVYQERSLASSLSIAENIFSGRHPVGRFGLINWRELYARALALLEIIDFGSIDLRTSVGSLSPSDQQMVEIAKALLIDAKILILDEPTTTITEKERVTLFRNIRKLKERGVAVFYISHRIAEVFEIADRVSVLKDGRYMGTMNVKEVQASDVIHLMVGRDLLEREYCCNATKDVVFEIRNFNSHRFREINFKLLKGEILTFAGLAGSGRTELARAIIGADRKAAGEVFIEGKKCSIGIPLDAIRNGIGYMPEDRKQQGLFLEMSIAENIYSAKINLKRGVVDKRKTIELEAQGFRAKLRITTPAVDKKVVELSGGNQQKVVLAKWLSLNPNILIVDEPTIGVDVGAKSEIYRILCDLTKEGTSIIIISSDISEVLAISDRVLVMSKGKITGEMTRTEATEEKIVQFASGLHGKDGNRETE